MNRFLVPLANSPEANLCQAQFRASADFVAQLIATTLGVPQTRLRRRAEPDAASAAYTVRDQSPALPGRALSRSL